MTKDEALTRIDAFKKFFPAAALEIDDMAKSLSKQSWISVDNYLPYCDQDLLVNYGKETKNVLTLTESFEFVVQRMIYVLNGWQFNKCNNIKYWTVIPDLPNESKI